MADPDRWMELLAKVQSTRASIEEAQTAAWHLMALPARSDVRKLQARVSILKQRAQALELAVARLERALTTRREGGSP